MHYSKLISFLLLFSICSIYPISIKAPIHKKISLGDSNLPNYVVDRFSSDCYQTRTTTYHNNQMSNYFLNLRDNFPHNEYNTCTEQSMSMLLAYFDTYYNDNIVSDSFIVKSFLNSYNDIYTVTSPGAESDFFSCSFLSNFVRSNPNYSMQVHLMNIAQSLNLTSGSDFSLNTTEMNSVLNYYLSLNNCSNLFTSSYYPLYTPATTNYGEYGTTICFDMDNPINDQSTIIKSSIVSYISQGIPVIAGVSFITNDNRVVNHAMIAYDYDQLGNIYFHSGFEDDLTIQLTGSYLFVGYTVLIPTSLSNHIHSSNYLYNQDGICSCELPNHSHSYGQYSQYTSSAHKKYCFCGDFILESHSWIRMVNGQNRCSNCRFITNGGVIINSNESED